MNDVQTKASSRPRTLHYVVSPPREKGLYCPRIVLEAGVANRLKAFRISVLVELGAYL
jgi:hypothetical protein